LSYTDPSGYLRLRKGWWRLPAAIAITVITSGAASGTLFAGTAFGTAAVANGFATVIIGGTLSGGIATGTLKGAVKGGIFAAITFGIAHGGAGRNGWIGASKTGGFDYARAFAHAITGGISAEVDGGKFGHGFASSILSSGADKLGLANIPKRSGRIIANAIVAGTISELTGGKFANGAMSAAFRVAFNEAIYVKNGDDAVLTKSSLNVKEGYGSVNDAVLAQYAAYDAEYQTASDNSNELLGAIFKTGSRFYFTNVVEVEERFNVGISISGLKKGSSYAAFTHTHPGGSFGFGGGDDALPNSTQVPFFVRLPSGKALRLNPGGAKKFAKYKASLKRSRSMRSLPQEIDAKRFGITNICGGTSSCLNKLQ